jgi:hypothetical protein
VDVRDRHQQGGAGQGVSRRRACRALLRLASPRPLARRCRRQPGRRAAPRRSAEMRPCACASSDGSVEHDAGKTKGEIQGIVRQVRPGWRWAGTLAAGSRPAPPPPAARMRPADAGRLASLAAAQQAAAGQQGAGRAPPP